MKVIGWPIRAASQAATEAAHESALGAWREVACKGWSAVIVTWEVRASPFAQGQQHGVVQTDEPAFRHHPVALGLTKGRGQLFQRLLPLGHFHRFGAEGQ